MRRWTSVGALVVLAVALAACRRREGLGGHARRDRGPGAEARRRVGRQGRAEQTAKIARERHRRTRPAADVTIPLDGAIDFGNERGSSSPMDLGSVTGAAGMSDAGPHRRRRRCTWASGSLPAAAKGFFEQRLDGKALDQARSQAASGSKPTRAGARSAATPAPTHRVPPRRRRRDPVGTEDVRGCVDHALPRGRRHGKAVAELPPRMRTRCADAGLRRRRLEGRRLDRRRRHAAQDVDATSTAATGADDRGVRDQRLRCPGRRAAPPADDVVDFATVFPSLHRRVRDTRTI